MDLDFAVASYFSRAIRAGLLLNYELPVQHKAVLALDRLDQNSKPGLPGVSLIRP